MSVKTAKGLVDYCKAQLGNPYWYGTFGNMSSPSLLATKRRQYPGYYEQSRYKVKFTNQYNKRVHDCVGLIKGYLWSETPTSTPKYNSSQDVSANGMLGKCRKRGRISSIPNVPGTLVFMKGHVGVYIGDGYVIEARGHDYGVVRTKLSSRPWTDWGMCPWIDYSVNSGTKPTTTTTPTNKPSVIYFKKYTGRSISIVDALAAQGAKTNFAYRSQIAKANGIKNYVGAPQQNIKMLNLIKSGKLIKP